MEEQGATARQANSGNNGLIDDENSQAEGTVEGAVGYATRNNENNNNVQANNNNNNNNNSNGQNHPHYENIYESIERYNVAPAEGQQQLQQQQNNNEANPNLNLNNLNISNNNNNNINNNSNNIAVNNNIAVINNLQQQPQPQQAQAQQQQRVIPNINYRNDLYDRTNTNVGGGGVSGASAYDVPRSVRSQLGFRRKFQIDWQSANRFNTSRCNVASSTTAAFYGKNCTPRQRSFDDTESHNYYNLSNYQPTLRYENIYEQIRDEPPLYRTATGARVYGRLNVIGHGIGRIERHLSSSCGNIDHFNVGGHYAVLGHSHFGTVGHIRLNAVNNGGGSAGSAASSNSNVCNRSCPGFMNPSNVHSGVPGAMGYSSRDPNNVKNSTSSFFSCLHGENSQSLNNICRSTGGMQHFPGSSNYGTPNNSKERESRTAASSLASSANSEASLSNTRQTGAIPKIKALNLGSNKANKEQNIGNNNTEKSNTLKNALTKKNTTNAAGTINNTTTKAKLNEPSNGTLNRISKSSLQWLLVNKWLPLWMGQGPDCKVIDFNFMFSRDCVGCDAAQPAQIANPYGTPRLGNLPQDLVPYSYGPNNNANSNVGTSTGRRDFQIRPMHSNLNRLRESELGMRSNLYRYEDPSYENVHVQWQNGFEFGRSRDYEHNGYMPLQQQQQQSLQQQQQRPQLQRARSESPNFSRQQNRRVGGGSNIGINGSYGDPFKNYELNTENNTFKPKLAKMEPNYENFQAAEGQTSNNRSSPPPKPAVVSQQQQQQPQQVQPLIDDIEEPSEGAVGGGLNNDVIAQPTVEASANLPINNTEAEASNSISKETTQAQRE